MLRSSRKNSGGPFVLPSAITSDDYRRMVKAADMVSSRVRIKQTDLLISGSRNLEKEAREIALMYRRQIENYIEKNPNFRRFLSPIKRDPFAPKIINTMIEAAAVANVGPMASVAGVIAEYVGSNLLEYSKEIIVENGGDVFICSQRRIEFLLLAESSEFKGMKIATHPFPHSIGVCTSSGKVGPSLSFGKADAVMVVGNSSSIADAAATAIANTVRKPSDIKRGIERSKDLGLYGAIIIVEDHMGVWGQLEILE